MFLRLKGVLLHVSAAFVLLAQSIRMLQSFSDSSVMQEDTTVNICKHTDIMFRQEGRAQYRTVVLVNLTAIVTLFPKLCNNFQVFLKLLLSNLVTPDIIIANIACFSNRPRHTVNV